MFNLFIKQNFFLSALLMMICCSPCGQPLIGKESTTLAATEVKRAKGERVDTPFVVQKDLQSNSETTGKKCLKNFKAKGGTFITLNPFEKKPTPFVLLPGDIVYPGCSAGFCRSQTLWALLAPYRSSITLFAPHATRYGCDPFNGKVNWRGHENLSHLKDEFVAWAGYPKILRFGYDRLPRWKKMGSNPTAKDLAKITEYYDEHYYGPFSVSKELRGGRRVYITFAVNAHVLLYRLNQNHEELHDVVVVHIDLDDLISKPLSEWNTHARSEFTYKKMAKLLESVLDFSLLF